MLNTLHRELPMSANEYDYLNTTHWRLVGTLGGSNEPPNLGGCLLALGGI